MIPLIFCLSLISGIASGFIAVFACLIVIYRMNNVRTPRKVNYDIIEPEFEYNTDLTTKWLNRLLKKLYHEATKSDMLYPIVYFGCKNVAESEKTISRLTLCSFSLGQTPPSLKSVRIVSNGEKDFCQFNFNFSPELNLNLDIELQLYAGINIMINAGCAVFLQYLRGGLNLAIPKSYGVGNIFFSPDIDMNIVVGAAINEVYVNSDEYAGTWERIKKIAEGVIRKVNIKIPLEVPEPKPKVENVKSEVKPEPKKKGFFNVKVSVQKPTEILMID